MLYKYRTLDNFKFVLDILVNQRFYATTYDAMNDPMEGVYTHHPDMPKKEMAVLEKFYKKIKFCSLSRTPDNPLMWAHYSAGARGIVIGVELKKDADQHEVKYDGPSHLLADKKSNAERAKGVLCYKNDFWNYEEEMRVFANPKHGNYVPVTVKQIIFGERVDVTEKSILKKVIEKINPSIEVIEKRKG